MDALPEGVQGWLTAAQAARLAAAVAGPLPDGPVVEIGSFHGRSTIVLARAAAAAPASPSAAPREIVAIDPHAGGDRGPQEFAPDAARGDADHERFTANLAAAGVDGLVRHVRRPSADAHDAVAAAPALLFVDGAHRFGPARADLVRWGARVAPGGTMLVHDAWSSIGVTLGLLTSCTVSPRWAYRGRTGSLAEYRRLVRPLGPAALARDVAAQLAELPWFARNVAIKVLVLAGRRGAAERIGLEPGAPWPY